MRNHTLISPKIAPHILTLAIILAQPYFACKIMYTENQPKISTSLPCFLCFSDGSARRLLCLIRPFFHRRQNPLPMRFHSTKKTPLLRKTEKEFSVCFSYIQFIEYSMEISMLVPFPISLSIKIFPLCSAAPCLTIESPKPVPPFSAERLASTR